MGNPTTRRTGRAGQLCANAAGAIAVTPDPNITAQYPNLLLEFRFNYAAVPSNGTATVTVRLKQLSTSVLTNRFAFFFDSHILSVAFPPLFWFFDGDQVCVGIEHVGTGKRVLIDLALETVQGLKQVGGVCHCRKSSLPVVFGLQFCHNSRQLIPCV